jgi:hypothetical protein
MLEKGTFSWPKAADVKDGKLRLNATARQAAEIVILKQTIDALSRRIFGTSSEKLDPAQLELLLG